MACLGLSLWGGAFVFVEAEAMIRLFVVFLVFLLTSYHTFAQDKIIVKAAHYPEGLFWDDRTNTLYYAEMPRDRVMRYKNNRQSVFFLNKGCGPTGIAPVGDKWAITCHIGRSLIIADHQGRFVEEIKTDNRGEALQNPNDIVSFGGGVYLTDSGRFKPDAPASGAIFYWYPGHGMQRLIGGLHYANGVTIDASSPTLFVSEHLGRRILAFPIRGRGELGPPRTFANLANKLPLFEPLTGADGLEFGPDGRLYAAIYGAGRIMVFEAGGTYLRSLARSETYLTTISFLRGENALFAAGAFDNQKYPYSGNIMRIDLGAD